MQVSSLGFGYGRSTTTTFIIAPDVSRVQMTGTQTGVGATTGRLCLPIESPLGRIRSIVGGESIPRIFPRLSIDMNVKGGDNEENN